MKIANIMSRNVQIIGPDQTLREAAGTMKMVVITDTVRPPMIARASGA